MKKALISSPGEDDDAGFAVFAQIRELLGDDDAEELARLVGGERIALPRPSKLTEKHPLAVRIGFELASRLVYTLSPEKTGVPRFAVPKFIDIRLQRLLEEDGLTAREIAQRLRISQRTVHRYRKRMKSKGLRIGDWRQQRTLEETNETRKGEKIVRTLLLEGHSPSQIRDILNVPGQVVLSIKAQLLNEGKL